MILGLERKKREEKRNLWVGVERRVLGRWGV